MAWSYDPTNLNTTTAQGRLNSIRLLVGDTDETDQLVQDEEIAFALSQVGDNIYYAGSWICRVIAAKFSRLVTTELSGSLKADYSDRSKQYQQLAAQIENQGKKTSGRSLGAFGGGLGTYPPFTVGQFDNVEAGDGYIPDQP